MDYSENNALFAASGGDELYEMPDEEMPDTGRWIIVAKVGNAAHFSPADFRVFAYSIFFIAENAKLLLQKGRRENPANHINHSSDNWTPFVSQLTFPNLRFTLPISHLTGKRWLSPSFCNTFAMQSKFITTKK